MRMRPVPEYLGNLCTRSDTAAFPDILATAGTSPLAVQSGDAGLCSGVATFRGYVGTLPRCGSGKLPPQVYKCSGM